MWCIFDLMFDGSVHRHRHRHCLRAGLANVEKRVAFAQSIFAITRKISIDHADWTPERISSHQHWMANQATAIWRIA